MFQVDALVTTTQAHERITNPALVQRALMRATELGAEATMREASKRAPVDTGSLRASGRVERDPTGHSVYFFGGAKGKAYAAYQELGTRKMRAQPYVRPAAASIDHRGAMKQASLEVLGI